jgi:hypothetical protein
MAMTMRRVNLADAKARLSELVRRAATGDPGAALHLAAMEAGATLVSFDRRLVEGGTALGASTRRS